MNCRPGDLARIYGMPPACGALNDRIVKLKDEPPVIEHGEPHWRLAEQIDFVIAHGGVNTFTGEVFVAGDEVFIDMVGDKYLRPIRGLPGTDEMVLRTGKPKTNDLAPKRQVEFSR